jgi:hypothetical protein
MESIQIIEATIDSLVSSPNENLPVLCDLQLVLVGGGCGETVFD